MAFPQVTATGTAHGIGWPNVTQNSQSKTVNCPAHNAGDRLILMMAMDGNPVTYTVSDVQGTTDDGWVSRYESGEGPSMRLVVREVVSRASSGSSQDITVAWTSQAEMIAAQIIAVDASHTTSAIQVSAENADTSTAPNPLSLSPSWGSADTLWIALCGYDGGTKTITAYPTSFTNGTNVRSNDSSGVGIGYARREQATSIQNPTSFTLSSSDGWDAITIAIRPDVATGTPQTIEVGLVIEDEIALPITIDQVGVEPPAPEVDSNVPMTIAQRAEMLGASAVRYLLSRVEVLSERDELETDDISNHVLACQIEHGSQRNINRIVNIDLDTDLDWGRQRIKPYLTVEGAGWTDTRSMGVFCLTAPTLVGGVRPPRFSVQGYDKMYLLDQPLAFAVSVPAGQPVLASVRDMLALRGIGVDRISNDRGSDTLLQAHAWGVEQGFTYLRVINDLLAMLGYRALRIDPDGFPESGPHPPISQRFVMWRYDSGSPVTTVYLTGREHVDDYTDRPNRWVFWRNDLDADTPPVEGDGLYSVDNSSNGPSSQTARGGLVITRAEGIEALTQADLVANGDRIVAEDMLSSTTMRLTTSLNPYHDHEDVVEVIDRDMGVAGPHELMVWNMDVFSRQMTLEFRSIEGGIV